MSSAPTSSTSRGRLQQEAVLRLQRVLPAPPDKLPDPGLSPASLDSALEAPSPPGVSKPLLQVICYGVTRHYQELHNLISKYLHKKLPRKDHDLYLLLLVGLYQLLATRSKAAVVVSESVHATSRLRKPRGKGLVNAILRKASADSKHLQTALSQASFPDWLDQQIREDWPARYSAILAESHRQAPMALRFNTRTFPSIDEARQALTQADLPATPGSYAKTCLYLDSPAPADALPGFSEGDFSVQDEAAQLACQWFALPNSKKPARILDACAAPGGKTGWLLENTGNSSELVATERDPVRASRITDNLERITHRHGSLRKRYQVKVADATDPASWWDGTPFDAILLDAPCSGTGVIRRHPDIKWLRTPSDIESLAAVQYQLLDNLWPLLAPGGQLVYATCSILKDENEKLVKAFVKAHNDSRIDSPWPGLAPAGTAILDTGFGWQLFPEKESHDGFFMARLLKDGKQL